jgi:hypothetical protein
MRIVTLLGLSVAAVVVLGCKTTNYVYVDAAVPTGHDCPLGDECYGGTFCFEGTCTVTCTSNAECWSGTECRPYNDAGEMACVTVRYQTGPVMVGTSCGVDPNACAAVDPECDPQYACQASCTDDSTCSPGYHCSPEFNTCLKKLLCYARVQDDPDGYCTQECTDDRDCPSSLYCEYVASDTNPDRKLCVRRTFCSPCLADKDCNLTGGVCATDAQGNKFCTTPCVPTTDPGDPNFFTCPQPYSECKDNGAGRFLCYHRAGSCVGDGSVCSPCRSRKDCDVASGAICYRNQYTQERFCTSTCTGAGTCPDSSYVCFSFSNDCEKDAHCYAPGGKCNLDTGTCDPENPPQCLKDFDPQNTTNPRYPTCYPDIAGNCCD